MMQATPSHNRRSGPPEAPQFLLLMRPEKNFKESRQKNCAGAIEEHLGRRLGEKVRRLSTPVTAVVLMRTVVTFQELKLPKSARECLGNYLGITHGDQVIIVEAIFVKLGTVIAPGCLEVVIIPPF
jgi:hypothetical protein